MKKIIISLIGILISLNVVSQSINVTSNASLQFNSTNEIFGFGDSQTANGGYGAQLISLLGNNWSYRNYGIGGNTSAQLVARTSALKKVNAHTVVIWIGANDLIGALTATTTIRNIRAICVDVKGANPNAKIVLLTTTPFATNAGWTSGKQLIQDTLNAAILNPTVITQADVRVNTYTLLGGGTNSLTAANDIGDGLHLSATGQILVGNITYTAVPSWSASVVSPTLAIARNVTRILEQDLAPNSSPVFKVLTLTDSLKTGTNIVQCGPLTSSGAIVASGAISATGNSTITGILYSTNSFQLGASGVNGQVTSGGGALKIVGGSSTPDVRICPNSASNGRFMIVSSTGNILMGDNGSQVDDGVTQVQIQSSLSVPNVTMTGTAPTLNLQASSGSLTGQINFRNSAGTNTYAAIWANSSTGEVQYFARSGGYFPTWYANGSEKMRLLTGGQLCIGNSTGAATVNVTGNAKFSTGIIGTTTNDNAVSGCIGETLSTYVASGSAVTFTTATAMNVATLSITAGDWLVSGQVTYNENTSTVTERVSGINSTSATVPSDGSETYCGVQSTLTSEKNTTALAAKRISVASVTTIYLVGKATFSAGSATGYGFISAVRIR